jgi:hypothetical protein
MRPRRRRGLARAGVGLEHREESLARGREVVGVARAAVGRTGLQQFEDAVGQEKLLADLRLASYRPERVNEPAVNESGERLRSLLRIKRLDFLQLGAETTEALCE